jgi:hypothetical protein
MEADMASRSCVLTILLLAVALTGCTLPGLTSPTPFTFPTPNLTHTAVFTGIAFETSTPLPPPTQAVASATAKPVGTITGTVDPLSVTATPGTKNTRPNGNPITAAYLSSPPTIDGDLGEWTSTLYVVNETAPHAGENWTGETDLSATFYIGWDVDYLYLGVKRTDDTFVQISWGRYMYRGDDIEIQLDTDLAGDFDMVTMSGDDYQVGLSPGNFGSIASEAYRWYPRYLESWLTTVVLEAVETKRGYDLEAKIPWSVFDITPMGDSRFGFAISLSDNDIPGTSDWQSMVSSVNTRRVTDPTTWGTLILEPAKGK